VPRVTFVLPDGARRPVDVAEGTTLLQAARRDGIEVEGACGGSMACATCHVHVEDAWLDRLPPPSAEEEDMLDFAKDLRPTSRLGCQIRVGRALDGLTVSVPRSTLLGG
jgi:2Fe-2S ferredoxin